MLGPGYEASGIDDVETDACFMIHRLVCSRRILVKCGHFYLINSGLFVHENFSLHSHRHLLLNGTVCLIS